MNYGQYLDSERKKLGMGRKQFCDAVGISTTTLAKYETGAVPKARKKGDIEAALLKLQKMASVKSEYSEKKEEIFAAQTHSINATAAMFDAIFQTFPNYALVQKDDTVCLYDKETNTYSVGMLSNRVITARKRFRDALKAIIDEELFASEDMDSN